MNTPEPEPRKIPSLADYLVRYDLATMIEEAQMDYGQTSFGAPRLLNQKDIAARFRTPRRPKKGSDEQS